MGDRLRMTEEYISMPKELTGGELSNVVNKTLRNIGVLRGRY